MNDPGKTRLVPRFAFTTLCVFAAVAVVLWWVLAAVIRERVQSTAQEHAQFVTHSVIHPALSRIDLEGPVLPDDPRYKVLRDLVVSDVLRVQFPVVRVKVWGPDGTVLFSDEPRLVGHRFPPVEDLTGAFGGRVASATVDPARPENAYERRFTGGILATYVPIAPSGSGPDPSVVVEIDTDTAAAGVPVGRPFRLVGLALLVGLAAIYVIQLPVVRRLGRTLRAQNQRLQDLLRQEQRTVEELRELSRRQGEFLAITSHELRTPLTSIAGFARTLHRPEFRGDPSAQEEFLDAIERQAARLGAMIENILTVSQLTESAQSSGSAPLDEAAAAVVARLGQIAERVDVDIERDLPDVAMDGRLLELVLSNLVDNALKFSPDGSPCRLGARLDGREVVAWVEDDGIGIAPEHVDRIFDRFFQVDASSTRRHGGVGLGLHLVKAAVDGVGGTVETLSVSGSGTRFTVRLPTSDVGIAALRLPVP